MNRFPKPIRLIIFLSLSLWTCSEFLRAAPALQYVPAENEVVVGINVRGIMDSPLMQSLLDPAQPNRLNAGLQALAAVTGTDLKSDVNNIYLYGQIGHPETVGMIAEGRFDAQKLLSLIQAKNQYTSFFIESVGASVV